MVTFFLLYLPPSVGCSPPETFRATRSIPSRTTCDPPAHEAAGGYGSRRRQPTASVAIVNSYSFDNQRNSYYFYDK